MRPEKKIISCMIAALTGLASFQLDAAGFEMLVDSNEPNTDVFDVTDAANKKLIGKTPVSFKKEEEVEGKLLLVEKSGYAPVYIPIPDNLKRGVKVNVELKKSQDWTPAELTRKSMETAEKIVDQVLIVQVLLDSRKVAEALPLAENLKNSYPESVSARLVYANALLLSGDIAKADSIYGILLEEIPLARKSMRDSIETVRMKLRGGRLPASAKRR